MGNYAELTPDDGERVLAKMATAPTAGYHEELTPEDQERVPALIPDTSVPRSAGWRLPRARPPQPDTSAIKVLLKWSCKARLFRGARHFLLLRALRQHRSHS